MKRIKLIPKFLFTKKLELLVRVLSWMLAVIKLQEPIRIEDLQPLILKMSNIFETRGIVAMVEWCKNLRLSLLHHLSGEWMHKRVKGVPVTKDGCPKVLKPLLKMKPYNTTLIRLILTVLYSTRALKLGGKPDVQTIIDPPLVEDISILNKHTRAFWRTLGYRSSATKIPRKLWFKRYHMTTKAGPNGHALGTSMVDFKLLLQHTKLVKCIKIVGGPKLENNINVLEAQIDNLPKSLFHKEGKILRRLTYFADKEMKVRIVAILDYFSQTALRPLHSYMFDVLRKIPQDCTFEQEKGAKWEDDWEMEFSFDLSAATDRFYINVICLVLAALLPLYYVHAWRYIMVGLPFSYTCPDTKVEKIIYYGTGNPMGAYTSWSTFAIAHHYIMFWCCMELGIDWSTSKYRLLGDDIRIGDPLLAYKYLETMNFLGVQISPIKTHVSPDLFEFAKRLFYKGTEISPFPISALAESSSKFYLLVNLFVELEKKGWVFVHDIPTSIGLFYSRILKYPSRKVKEFEERSFLTYIITLVIRGSMTAADGLTTICRRHGILTGVTMTEYNGISILSGVALQVFAADNPLEKQDGALGNLAIQYVSEITSNENIPLEVAIDLPSKIPILFAYGLVEEKYLDLNRKAFLIDTIEKGEWPMHLRTLALPVSDKIFTERASHTIIRVGAILGDKVLQNLKTLRPSDFDW